MSETERIFFEKAKGYVAPLPEPTVKRIPAPVVSVKPVKPVQEPKPMTEARIVLCVLSTLFLLGALWFVHYRFELGKWEQRQRVEVSRLTALGWISEQEKSFAEKDLGGLEIVISHYKQFDEPEPTYFSW